MMKTVIKSATLSLAFCAALVGFAPQASASLYVEPFIGYMMGDTEASGALGGYKEDTTGTDMGLRLGFSTLGFAVGAEASQSSFEIDTDPSTDLEPTNLGLFASFEFPILIRAYASYIIESKGDYGNAEVEGDGLRLGVGFTGLPFVSINFEYLSLKYDTIKAAGFSVDTDIKTDLYGVNVSLPLDFF